MGRVVGFLDMQFLDWTNVVRPGLRATPRGWKTCILKKGHHHKFNTMIIKMTPAVSFYAIQISHTHLYKYNKKGS